MKPTTYENNSQATSAATVFLGFFLVSGEVGEENVKLTIPCSNNKVKMLEQWKGLHHTL